MRARKVAINYDSNSTPERFYTARKAQAVADECNIPGETYQIIVGCLRPKYYVLLIDDGETVKYYSALSETWIPVCGEVAEEETVEPEAEEAATEKKAPVFQVGKKYCKRTFSGRLCPDADITVVSVTDKFVTFYDPATGGNAMRKIKTGEGYQHFTCEYGKHGTYTTSWFEVEQEDKVEADVYAELAAGEEQINAADAIVMDFLWNLAIKEGYEVSYRWKEYGCLKHRKADKGRIVFVFEGPRELPDVRTERGEYCFGGYGAGRKTGSIIDRLHQLFSLRVERGYKVPADRPYGFEYQCSSWGPVLSVDMDEMLLICQQQEVMVNDEVTPEAIKHAAKSLLNMAYIEADGSELARACAELHARGLCEFRPAAGIGRFGYWPSTRTQEALTKEYYNENIRCW